MEPETQPLLPTLRDLIKKHQTQLRDDYFTFLRYPSISSEPEFKDQLLECAGWLTDYLKKMGFEVEIWPTSGHPTIFATYLKAGPERPTLLIYNHYDVQPVDPLEAWQTPPFEPTVQGHEVYARGAQDNKGQCFYVLQALKLYLEASGSLPLNIKLCIEGEEEIGSAGLAQILSKKADALKADYLAIVDLGIPNAHTPAVTLGIRGIVTMDVEVQTTRLDLHSGSHGGIVINPIQALVKLLAGVHDEQGHVRIPGFYDKVEELSPEDRKQISFQFDEHKYREITGALPLGGEQAAYSPLERAWIRPTFEINGIYGGYTGKGFKTVIPAKASAKVSCRLVPKQDPQEIGELVADYLRSQAPEGVQVHVHIHPGGGKAVRINPSAKVVQAFIQAFEEVFKTSCESILEGGSIPIVTELALASGADVILVGLGLAGDQIHAPNEHFGLDRIEKGILMMARAIDILGSH